MPPRKAGGAKGGGQPAAKKGLYNRPDPIVNGAILTDLAGKQWRIGRSIGAGGFGEIYLASDDISKGVTDKAPYVVKIEPHDNGPLFVEINVYIRIAKPEMIEEWKKSHRVESLGMPWYVTSGNYDDSNNKRYRFMVIPRFGQDLQKILVEKPGKRFHIKTVQAIALQVIDTLEYIHSKDYIHGDIKASNLMVGLPTTTGSGRTKVSNANQLVYLLDYGLASKYVNSERTHVPYEKDLRKAHNGTLEYTSRDAHIGAFSRRGDLEILGYNLLEWLCGKLPWSATDTVDSVSKQKNAFMTQIKSNGSLKKIYPTSQDIPGLDILEAYLRYVSKLDFQTEPDYKHCKDLLKKGLPKANNLYLDEVAISPAKPKAAGSKYKRVASAGDVLDGPAAPPEVVPKKLKIPDEDEPVKRGTRTTKKVNINWTRVLSSDPEKIVRSVNGAGGSSSTTKETTPSPSKSPPIVNPTPAMLQILHKRKENMATPVVSTSRARSPAALRAAASVDDLLNGNLVPGRSTRRGAGRKNFEVKAATLENPTPAMLQVLAKSTTTSKRK